MTVDRLSSRISGVGRKGIGGILRLGIDERVGQWRKETAVWGAFVRPVVKMSSPECSGAEDYVVEPSLRVLAKPYLVPGVCGYCAVPVDVVEVTERRNLPSTKGVPIGRELNVRRRFEGPALSDWNDITDGPLLGRGAMREGDLVCRRGSVDIELLSRGQGIP